MIDHVFVSLHKLLRILNKEYGCVFEFVELNHGRHYFLKPNKPNVPSFYFKFTREFLNSFNFQFQSYVLNHPDMAGVGQSINKEYLEYAKRRNADFVIVGMPDGCYYYVYTDTWINYCQKHNLIRTQDRVNDYKGLNGVKVAKREETYVLPANLPMWKKIGGKEDEITI